MSLCSPQWALSDERWSEPLLFSLVSMHSTAAMA
ncbi:hypothetical protein EST38_g4695 [Candolleomyces aberdarensis]|uniref:Uncharacterized protein n=1 Tax=Candolleomyces aberdarensis TaxID=2316362 RepID=A0A4Q2DLY6_9AGAR|nr:hypothetical protein EST38_g4695 [Candolleomyces aberdarensis]